VWNATIRMSLRSRRCSRPLHMGDQTMTPEEAAVRNPLRIYQQDGADQPPVADEQAGGIDHE